MKRCKTGLISAVAAASLMINVGTYAANAPAANSVAPTTLNQMLNGPMPKNLTRAQAKKLRKLRAQYRREMAKLTPQQRAQVYRMEADMQNKIDLARQNQPNQNTSGPVKSIGARGFGSPSVSILSPNAFGDGNAVFGSIGYVNHFTNAPNSSDGFMGVGGSFGNAKKYVDVTLGIDNDNIGWRAQPFASNGGFSVRVNHYFAKETAVAAGAGNVGGWGVFSNASKNYYFSATQGFMLGLPITVNAGFGTGAFYSFGDSTTDRDNQIGPFGGIGISVYKNLSLIADYASREYNVGGNYNFIFLKKLPMFFSLAATNVNNLDGLHTNLQAILGFAVPL